MILVLTSTLTASLIQSTSIKTQITNSNFPFSSSIIPTCTASDNNILTNTIKNYWYLAENIEPNYINNTGGIKIVSTSLGGTMSTSTFEGSNYKFVYICYHWANGLYDSIIFDLNFRKSSKIQPINGPNYKMANHSESPIKLPISFSYQLLITDSSGNEFTSSTYLGGHLSWLLQCYRNGSTSTYEYSTSSYISNSGLLIIKDITVYSSFNILLVNNNCVYRGDVLLGNTSNLS